MSIEYPTKTQLNALQRVAKTGVVDKNALHAGIRRAIWRRDWIRPIKVGLYITGFELTDEGRRIKNAFKVCGKCNERGVIEYQRFDGLIDASKCPHCNGKKVVLKDDQP